MKSVSNKHLVVCIMPILLVSIIIFRKRCLVQCRHVHFAGIFRRMSREYPQLGRGGGGLVWRHGAINVVVLCLATCLQV